MCPELTEQLKVRVTEEGGEVAALTVEAPSVPGFLCTWNQKGHVLSAKQLPDRMPGADIS